MKLKTGYQYTGILVLLYACRQVWPAGGASMLRANLDWKK